jgi:hypothetical protein
MSAGATQTSRSDPQLGARRRTPYQDNLDTETQDGSSAHVTQPSGQGFKLPKVQHGYGNADKDVHIINLGPTPNNTVVIPQSLQMLLPDGTNFSFEDGGEGRGLEMVPAILRELSRREPDAKHPSSFAEHYISLAPLPQFRNFDTTTYLLSKDHYNDKSTVCIVHSCPKPR